MSSENTVYVTQPSTSGSDHSRFSNQFKGLVQYNIPSHLLDARDETGTKQDEDELATRENQQKRARDRRGRNKTKLETAEKDLDEWEELLKRFNVADGIKEPDSDQLQTIQDLNASVVDVIVTAGAAELPRKIAARTKELKKVVDDHQAAYDKECKASYCRISYLFYLIFRKSPLVSSRSMP